MLLQVGVVLPFALVLALRAVLQQYLTALIHVAVLVLHLNNLSNRWVAKIRSVAGTDLLFERDQVLVFEIPLQKLAD